jgi:hypothetical protein
LSLTESRASIEVKIGEVAVGQHFVIGVVIIEALPVRHLEEGWCSVVFPVSDSVSDHESLEFWFVVVLSSSREIGIDSLDKLRDIDSSI